MKTIDRWNALYGWYSCQPPRDHFGYRCVQPAHSNRHWEQLIQIGGALTCLLNTLFFTTQALQERIDWYDWLMVGAGAMALIAAIVFGWLPDWRRTWGDPVWRTLWHARERLLHDDIAPEWQPTIFDDLPPIGNDPLWVSFEFTIAADMTLSCTYHRGADILMASAPWLDYQLLRLR